MKIYPKTSSDFNGLDKVMKYVEKYKGVELQFFDENGPMAPFDMVTPIEELMEKVPYLEEITVHPPLSHYDLECVLAKDENIVKAQLETMVMLSRKYGIKLNIVWHTLVNLTIHKEITVNKLRELLKIVEGEKVTLVVENLFMFFEKKCTPFELAEYINHPNLKVCFDLCHLYCRANIDDMDVREYADKYLDKELCKKYIYQIHFADTKNNDGYKDHKTHGRGHDTYEDVKKDFELLKEYNLCNCNYITELSEDDYSTRVDQIRELEFLERIAEEENN